MSEPITVLNVGQARRVEALRVSGEVLSNTRNIFGGKTPVPATGVDDLLKVASWVIGEETRRPTLADLLNQPGVGVMELKGEEVGGFLDFLASVGCGDPECEVHGDKAKTTEGTPDEDRRPYDTEAGDGGPWTNVGSTDKGLAMTDSGDVKETGGTTSIKHPPQVASQRAGEDGTEETFTH